MKSIYSWKKRQELKLWIKETSILIRKLKDERKTVRQRIYPDFVRQPGVWLDSVQYEFRFRHIVASMMRGKNLGQIERLPKNPNKIYVQPNMRFINEILESCRDDNVCVGTEKPVQVTAGSSSGACAG